MLCASRNHDFDSFYSVLAGLRLRDRTAKRAGVVTRCFSQCLIFRCFWIKPKAQEKSERRKTIGLIFREASRPFDSAFPANSSFYHLLLPKGGCGALRATMIIWLRSVLAGRRSSGAMGAVFRVKLKPILSSVSAVRKEERFFPFGCRRW